MIYGRRFFEKSQPRMSHHEQYTARLQRTQKSLRTLYHHFQHKYARSFSVALLSPMVLFSIPCIYFVTDNYDIFLRLAYDVRPDLIHHLEREKNLLLGLVGFMLVSSGLFCYWLTLKLTNHIIGPIWSLERHMKQVTLGDWSAEDFQIRHDDEFQSLASTYSYLYRTLKVHTQKEIEALESLSVDPKDQNNYIIIRNLIETKKLQLGQMTDPLTISETAAETSLFQGSRRAS